MIMKTIASAMAIAEKLKRQSKDDFVWVSTVRGGFLKGLQPAFRARLWARR